MTDSSGTICRPRRCRQSMQLGTKAANCQVVTPGSCTHLRSSPRAAAKPAPQPQTAAPPSAPLRAPAGGGCCEGGIEGGGTFGRPKCTTLQGDAPKCHAPGDTGPTNLAPAQSAETYCRLCMWSARAGSRSVGPLAARGLRRRSGCLRPPPCTHLVVESQLALKVVFGIGHRCWDRARQGQALFPRLLLAPRNVLQLVVQRIHIVDGMPQRRAASAAALLSILALFLAVGASGAERGAAAPCRPLPLHRQRRCQLLRTNGAWRRRVLSFIACFGNFRQSRARKRGWMAAEGAATCMAAPPPRVPPRNRCNPLPLSCMEPCRTLR